MGETRAVLRAAREQHGAVTTAQLLAAGWSKDAIARRARGGWLRRVHRGVYLVGPVVAEHARPMAAVLAVPDSVLGHHPAAVLHATAPPRDGPMHLIVAGDSRSRDGLRIHHTTLHPRDITRRHGIPVTSVARTLLDLAATEPAAVLDSALNEARALRLVSAPSLNEQFRRYPRHRGTGALKEAISEDTGFTRSRAERLLKALVRTAQLPTPQTNIRIEGHEVDAYWREPRLIVEFDSWSFHSLRRSFEQDRRRDQQLTTKGYRTIRITWRQLTRQPEAVIATLAAALAA